MNRSCLVLALVLSLAAPAASPAANNLLENGDFEFPFVPGKTYLPLAQGDFIGSWLVEEGAVDLITRHFWEPAKGRQSLDLDGSCGAGTIRQVVHPIPGRSYRLRFALAGNPGGPPVVKSLEVWWGDTRLDSPSFSVAGTSFRHMGWTYLEYVVTADSADVELRFVSLGVPDACYGAAVDDVTLEEIGSPAL
jgi:choice-of-anchor C domain-containing protein